MGFWQTLTGRTTPQPPQLDALFALPGAALTLETTLGFTPTGDGAVCYRSADGSAFADTERDVVALLRANPKNPTISTSRDEFGFTWLLVDDHPESPYDLGDLTTDLHAVTTGLEMAGFGPAVLCSLVPFTDRAGRRLGLVYLAKQGTFYPFAPTGPLGSHGPNERDNLLELQIRDLLRHDLPIEPDTNRWLALWGAPGL